MRLSREDIKKKQRKLRRSFYELLEDSRTRRTISRGNELEKEENHEDQGKKSVGRMPWHQEPKKDAISCEKLRGAANGL